MTDEKGIVPHTFDGYLLQWMAPGVERPPNSLREQIQEELLSIPGVSLADISLRDTWSLFSYESEVPLFVKDVASRGTHHYYFAVRVNSQTGNVIIGTSSKDASEGLIDTVFHAHLIPNFKRIQIRVANLANYLAEINSFDPELDSNSELARLSEDQIKEVRRYKLTYVSAEILDDGDDARSGLFFGEDLGNSKFFQKNRTALSARQIGVRERRTLKESARLGSDGYLRFYYRAGHGLQQLEQCLFFVNDLSLYVHPA